MKVDNIFLYQRYFKASVKIILVKVTMKTSLLVLHKKKADLKTHHSCFALFPFHYKLQRSKPQPVQRRFQSYDGDDYREVERRWGKNRIESCTRDTRFMTK